MSYIKVLAVVACIALACPSAYCVGLVNGGFEAGSLDGWVLVGSGTTYAATTVAPHTDSFCAVGTKADGGLGGLTQNFALPGGIEIKASFWYKAIGSQWVWGSSYGESSLVEFDGGGNVMAHTNLALLGLNYPTPANSWTYVSKTITTNAATVSAQIYMNAQVLQGDQLFLDDYCVASTAPVPEPTGLIIIASGALSLLARRRFVS